MTRKVLSVYKVKDVRAAWPELAEFIRGNPRIDEKVARVIERIGNGETRTSAAKAEGVSKNTIEVKIAKAFREGEEAKVRASCSFDECPLWAADIPVRTYNVLRYYMPNAKTLGDVKAEIAADPRFLETIQEWHYFGIKKAFELMDYLGISAPRKESGKPRAGIVTITKAWKAGEEQETALKQPAKRNARWE